MVHNSQSYDSLKMAPRRHFPESNMSFKKAKKKSFYFIISATRGALKLIFSTNEVLENT